MLDKVWTRINYKRPKGPKLLKIVGIVSAAVWVSAIAAFFLLKEKKIPAKADAAKHEEHKAEDAHGSHDSGHGSVEAHEHGEKENPHHAPPGSHPANPETHTTANHETGFEENLGAMPSREEVAALRQLAELLAAQGNWTQALEPMRRVMQVPTKEPALLSLAAKVFLSTGNYQEGLQITEHILAVNANDMQAKVQYVEAQFRLGRVDKAIASAQAALKDHPSHLEMLTALATIEVEMGPSHKEYGVSLDAALKLQPDFPPAVYLEGRKAQLEGNYKDAETAFRKAVKLEPANAKAQGQLGLALHNLGKEKEAEQYYRTTLAMNPKDYNTWFNLGELELTLASREKLSEKIQSVRVEAMACYLKALDLNPDHIQAHFRVGTLLNGNGQYKEAIRHLEIALGMDSRHVPTLVQLALAYESIKQPNRAKAYLTKAYELDPLNKVVLFKLRGWS